MPAVIARIERSQDRERLRPATEAAGIGEWIWDSTCGEIICSDRCRSFLGLAWENELTYEDFLGVVHSEDRSTVEDVVSRFIREPGDLSVEFRAVWPDGREHWLLASGHGALDEAGQLASAAGIVREITQEKGLQKDCQDLLAERQRQREFLQRLFDLAPIGIAVIDAREGRYLMVNPSYETNPGLPRISMGGHHVGDFAPPETAAFMKWIFHHVVDTRKPFSVREYEANLGPGRERTWWNNDVVPLLDKDGNVESVLALTREVTDQVMARKRIEELADQIQASRDQLEAVINSMVEGLVVIDRLGNIQMANPAAFAIHGFTKEEEFPRNLREYPVLIEVCTPDGREVGFDDWPLTRAMHGQSVRDVELHCRRKDTGRSWIGSYSAMPVLDPSGEVASLLVTIHDLTPSKS